MLSKILDYYFPYCTNLTTKELWLLERAEVLIIPPLLVIMYDVVIIIMYDWLAYCIAIISRGSS